MPTQIIATSKTRSGTFESPAWTAAITPTGLVVFGAALDLAKIAKPITLEVWVSRDNGVTYELLASGTWAGGTALVDHLGNVQPGPQIGCKGDFFAGKRVKCRVTTQEPISYAVTVDS